MALPGWLARLAAFLGLGAVGGDLPLTDRLRNRETPRLFSNPFAHPRAGAHGGGGGACPFPAPPKERFLRRVLHCTGLPFVKGLPRNLEARLRVNTTPQPWQVHAANLAKRVRREWNARRVEREHRLLMARLDSIGYDNAFGVRT